MNDKAKIAMTELQLASAEERAAIWERLAQTPIKGLGATPCDFHVEEGPVSGCELCEKINAKHLHIPSAFSRCDICGKYGVYNASVKPA